MIARTEHSSVFFTNSAAVEKRDTFICLLIYLEVCKASISSHQRNKNEVRKNRTTSNNLDSRIQLSTTNL